MAANAAPASAQEAAGSDTVPAHLYAVDGAATIERDGLIETAVENTLLLPGDRLTTDYGRIEVLFADGSALDIDNFTTVDVLSDSLLRLLEGRIRLAVTRNASGANYRVDAAPGSVWIRTAGDYRIALHQPGQSNTELELAVLRGSAELANDVGRTLVRAGTFAVTQASTLPSLPYTLNSAAWDEFDQWAEDLHDSRLSMASTSYLPADLRYYGGTLDRYGTWGHQPSYGYVWYPQVTAGWSPYSTGRWSFSARFGWAWVGAERWSWPTHHYGSWGVSSGRWYWMPGRQWSPAWVSWAAAPGYVSWSPLGRYGRPVFGLDVSIRVGGARLGWTVVPARVFGPNIRVRQHAVPHHNLYTVWSGFNRRTAAPDVRTANGQILRSPRGRSGTAVARVSPRDPARPPSRTPPRTTQGPSRTNRAAPPRATQDGRRTTGSRVNGARSRTSAAPPRPSTSVGGRSATTPPRSASPSRTRTTPPAAGPSRTSGPSRTRSAPPAAGPSRTSAPSRTRSAPPSAGPSRSAAPSRTRSAPPTAGPSRSAAPSRTRSAPPSRTGAARPRTSGAPPARSGSVGGRSRGAPTRSTAPSRTRSAPKPTTPRPSTGPSRGRSAPPSSGGRGSAVRRTGGRGGS